MICAMMLPRFLGWLDLGGGGYGFLFHGRQGEVLVAWSPPGTQHQTKFTTDVRVTGLAVTATHSRP
jgi:hypothetical protein